MKRANRFFVVIFLSTVFVGMTIAYAWPYNKCPSISFSDSYPKALTGLKDELGNTSTNFYCTHATLDEGLNGASDSWQFDFNTETGDRRIVAVFMDGKVSIGSK